MSTLTNKISLDRQLTEDGLERQYFYKCKIARSSKCSKDMKLAKRFFKLSEEIAGENFS